MSLTRREVLMAAAAAALAAKGAKGAMGEEPKAPRFRISACDWSLGKTQQIDALDLAREIGLDGVEVSFGGPGGQYDLRKPEVRTAYAERARKLGLEVSSLAMGVLNDVPYSTDERAETWVEECVETMAAMGQKRVLLAFFGKGDVLDRPELQEKVIARLKKVAPKAEKAGVVLGFESWLNADAHRRILDAVGSPAVKVYYDVANMTEKGYDILKEIRQLGRDRIVQIHCKENGQLLGKGRIDFPKVKAALDDIEWSGWLVIEGATVSGKSLRDCYVENQKYLRAVFGA